MDTLFRLVSLQSSTTDQSSFNSSRTSSSSRSSRSHNNHNHYHHHHHQNPFYNNHHQHHHNNYSQEEECFNFFMDNTTNNNEEDFSTTSSYSSKHNHPNYTTTTTAASNPAGSAGSPASAAGTALYSYNPTPPPPDQHHHNQIEFSARWAPDILAEAARALAEKNTARLQHAMWMLNELSSPYGDTDQKLAAYFLQALFSRMNDSGLRCHRTLSAASDKTCSFDSTRKTLLRFQELSPWTTFGHVASNGAIIEALDGEPKLHIVDLSNTYCTQWPTLLEALATRSDDTPHLRITTVVAAPAASHGGGASSQTPSGPRVMKEIGARMEKFARLMGVPFKFAVVHHSGDLSELNFADLDLRDDEALAVNFVNSLHSITVNDNRRDYFLSAVRSLRPRVVTVVEEEADMDYGGDGSDFVAGFQECVRWFRVYLETLDESFPRTSNERLMLERSAGRAVVDLVALPAAESAERRETAERWGRRLRGAGLGPASFSDEVCDDVRALLRRYKEGWAMTAAPGTGESGGFAGIFLTWKDQPVVWASAWRP